MPIDHTWCAKCKIHTDNGDSSIVKTRNGRTRQISTCLVCQTKKSRFIATRDKDGGSIPDEQSTLYANLAGSAYEPEKDRVAYVQRTVQGISLEQDGELSDAEQAVYVDEKGKKVIVSFRGTVPSVNDAISDARIVLGTLKRGRRYKKSEKVVDEVKEKYKGYDVELTGHSLGARISHDLAIEKGVKSHSFNIGSSPVDLPKGFWNYLKCKVTPELCEKIKKDNKVYHSVLDPISVSGLVGTADVKFYKPKVANVHGLANFRTSPG